MYDTLRLLKKDMEPWIYLQSEEHGDRERDDFQT